MSELDDAKPTAWWQTLPGILAAVAAVVTAVTGLVVAIHQNATGSAQAVIDPVDAAPAAQAHFSMAGSWHADGVDCTIEFFRDDGARVEGTCDNGKYSHHISGTYDGGQNQRITLTNVRRDPTNCETSVHGYIEVLSENRVRYWQEGWNGCKVRTEPAEQIWERKQGQG